MRNENVNHSRTFDLNDDWYYKDSTIMPERYHQFRKDLSNDRYWLKARLPHLEANENERRSTLPSSTYWYSKKFILKEQPKLWQQAYLKFESTFNSDRSISPEGNMKIFSAKIWLNDNEIYDNTLPNVIDITKYLRSDLQNLLVICSKNGTRLQLKASIVLSSHIVSNNAKLFDEKMSTYSSTDDDALGENFANIIHSTTRYAQARARDAEQYETINPWDNDNELHHENSKNYPDMTRIPQLAILILAVGSRGDVQPFVALAKALRAHGHRVRLATHEVFRSFVIENGIEFYPLAGDPAALMAFVIRNGGIIPSVSSIVAGDIQRYRQQITEILESTWKACIDKDDTTGVSFTAEAIIANPPSYGHIHCAEKLKVPLHMVFTMPWTPTGAFPHPLSYLNFNRRRAKRINRWSYSMIERVMWAGMGGIFNDFRANILGLKRLPLGQAVRLMHDEGVPFTYCWSPSLVPRPDDWPLRANVAGFFHLDLASNYQPPQDLIEFLRAGDPPIYIGFGSIGDHVREKLLQKILKALEVTGHRAILSGLAEENDALPDGVFRIGNCPHDWLFQHVSAVCHHGGAGTTAAGLRAGKPTIVVPFFGDQFFWGSVVHKNNAGPAPILGKRCKVKSLVRALLYVHRPEVLEAAIKLSVAFSKEDGCEAAVRSFHAHLPLDKLRSDLEPSFAACFRIEDYNLQVSRPVAQVLVAAKAVGVHDLSLNRVHRWKISKEESDSASADFPMPRSSGNNKVAVFCLRRAESTSRLERQSSSSASTGPENSISITGSSFKGCLKLYGNSNNATKEDDEDVSNTRVHVIRTFYHNSDNYTVNPTAYNRSHSTCAPSPSNSVRLAFSSATRFSASHGHLTQSHSASSRGSKPKGQQQSLLPYVKSLSFSRTNNHADNHLVLQRAADVSGYTTEKCKQILLSFKQRTCRQFESDVNDTSNWSPSS